jgi:hypothetical protein
MFENIESVKPQVPLAPLIRGALAGWAVLIAEFATPFVLRRNDPNFAPEVGPAAAFAIFGFFCICFICGKCRACDRPDVFAPLPQDCLPPSVAVGSVRYCTVPSQFDRMESCLCLTGKEGLPFWALLAGSAGAASFYVLAPKRPPNEQQC